MVDLTRYNGTFIARRERMAVIQLDPEKLPEDDVSNLFLKPIHAQGAPGLQGSGARP